MNWTISHQVTGKNPKNRRSDIISAILGNRDLTAKKDIEEFLDPTSPFDISSKEVGINQQQSKKAISRIQYAIKHKQPIIVYGDYDADGITATAIMWESLFKIGAKAFPFIPSRHDHGYGLSISGIKDAIKSLPLDKGESEGVKSGKPKPLIITVDNGIVAHEAATYVADLGYDLILTDHHQKAKTIPTNYALIHSDQIAGSGVAWFFVKDLLKSLKQPKQLIESTLDLVTIGTVADMLPLKDVNRSLVKFGLEVLENSSRPGIQSLLISAGIEPNTALSTYHINFVIAPRLNAMGRLEHAIDSLRLLCTTREDRARELAKLLTDTNQTRQDLTFEYINQAKTMVGDSPQNLIVLEHEDFHEGVIGLIAGKMVETYYRPTIIITKKEGVSKASARSVYGINIIELIRRFEHHLVNAGGHPMAAGFSIETQNIEPFTQDIQSHAEKSITKDQLIPHLKIDCQIKLSDITDSLFKELENLKPFGMGNPQPVFAIKQVRIANYRTIGKERQHLKVSFQDNRGNYYNAIGFGMGKRAAELSGHSGSGALVSPGVNQVDIAFTINENIWNGKRELQLRLKDIQTAT